ncbi:12407_t:CDS:2 [Funneliformis mosseae]|uniref:12407_t:CDS:1 n=1 Tax=Funneliformis mosseae TaxID=27381 RepID=A0A9N8VD88_FUNMO|nr:12407_t:CDS:2 [Funneliformis mosseae]
MEGISLKQALLYILPISYSDKAVDKQPLQFHFNFNDQLKFERPQFIQFAPLVNEEAVRSVFDANICQVLNKLLMPDYIIERRSDYIIGDLNFAVNFASDQLVMPIEVK